MLDDFANLTLPGFDDVLSVIRSREVSCTIICQTVSQLEARYDQAVANSIIGNCDRHLVLGFQDERTAKYFALRANKLPSTLLETPSGNWWLFERGRRGICEPAYALEQHPRYREFGRKLRDARGLGRGDGLRSCRNPQIVRESRTRREPQSARMLRGFCELRGIRNLGSTRGLRSCRRWRSSCNLGGAGESQSVFDLRRRRS